MNGRPNVGTTTLLLIPAGRKLREILAIAAGSLPIALRDTQWPLQQRPIEQLGELFEGVILAVLTAAAAWVVLGLIAAALQPSAAVALRQRLNKADWDSTAPALWAVLYDRRVAKEPVLRKPPKAALAPQKGSIIAYASQRFAQIADDRLIAVLEKRAEQLGMRGEHLLHAHMWAAVRTSMAQMEDTLPNPYAQAGWSRYLGIVGDEAWHTRSAITEKTFEEAVVPALGLDENAVRRASQILEAAIRAEPPELDGLEESLRARGPRYAARTRRIREHAAHLCAALRTLDPDDMETLLRMSRSGQMPLSDVSDVAARYASMTREQRRTTTTLLDTWEGHARDLVDVVPAL